MTSYNRHTKVEEDLVWCPMDKLFGYKVSYCKHEMDAYRKKDIDVYAMPTTTKGLQSCLGEANFIKLHVAIFCIR